MKLFRKLLRSIKINRVLTHYQIDKLIFENSKYSWLILVNKLFPWNWSGRSNAPRGERIRLALEELGPIFIKFGQALSTRKDLMPYDISLELAKLQDDCPPFDEKKSLQMIEEGLGHRQNL